MKYNIIYILKIYCDALTTNNLITNNFDHEYDP